MKRITVNGIKSTLNSEEERISDPEDIAIEIIQNKRQRDKNDWGKKKNRGLVSCGITYLV